MLEIRIHGREEQDAEVACRILADAFVREGTGVETSAASGGEPRGASVIASVRVADASLHERCEVEDAAHLIVLDPTLLAELPRGSLSVGGLVLVNSPRLPCGRLAGSATIVAVDAEAIADGVGLGPTVATTMAGAFAGATGLVSVESLAAAVEAGSPTRTRAHVEAAVRAFHEAARP